MMSDMHHIMAHAEREERGQTARLPYTDPRSTHPKSLEKSSTSSSATSQVTTSNDSGLSSMSTSQSSDSALSQSTPGTTSSSQTTAASILLTSEATTTVSSTYSTGPVITDSPTGVITHDPGAKPDIVTIVNVSQGDHTTVLYSLTAVSLSDPVTSGSTPAVAGGRHTTGPLLAIAVSIPTTALLTLLVSIPLYKRRRRAQVCDSSGTQSSEMVYPCYPTDDALPPYVPSSNPSQDVTTGKAGSVSEKHELPEYGYTAYEPQAPPHSDFGHGDDDIKSSLRYSEEYPSHAR
ncbi:hypothetical protein C8Q80DRAFT_449090 [Daedaleopsis nitida]|nr:hypothetical protein C8Q80DRAFT_449090 [Daedaleopsis nitida]